MSAEVEQIAVAAEEQVRGIEQINTAISSMEKNTQQTAAAAEEGAAASAELKAQTESIQASVSDLQQLLGTSKARA